MSQIQWVQLERNFYLLPGGKVNEKEKQLVSALKTMLGIQAKVHLVAPKSITRSEGKAVRVIDKRKLYD